MPHILGNQAPLHITLHAAGSFTLGGLQGVDNLFLLDFMLDVGCQIAFALLPFVLRVWISAAIFAAGMLFCFFTALTLINNGRAGTAVIRTALDTHKETFHILLDCLTLHLPYPPLGSVCRGASIRQALKPAGAVSLCP